MKLFFYAPQPKSLVLRAFLIKRKERKLQYQWYHNFRSYLVEATGVEPVSENPFIRTSTSVVCYSGKSRFPHALANKHALALGSLQYIRRLQASPSDVHHQSTPVPMPWYSQDRRALTKQQLIQNYCCRLILKRTPFKESALLCSLIILQNPRRSHYAPILTGQAGIGFY